MAVLLFGQCDHSNLEFELEDWIEWFWLSAGLVLALFVLLCLKRSFLQKAKCLRGIVETISVLIGNDKVTWKLIYFLEGVLNERDWSVGNVGYMEKLGGRYLLSLDLRLM